MGWEGRRVRARCEGGRLRWLPWAGWCSFSLFFFCGMVVGYSFECFVFIRFFGE